MAITITQLRAFIAVVEGGSVTAAADELIVTQPSVSSALAALARELGCELFERSGRGIQLTDAGRAFAPYATDVLGLLRRGRDAAREAEADAGRRVRIAAGTPAAESFVPPLMRAFSDEHPETELTLVVGNHETVLEQILGHAVDVAITGAPSELSERAWLLREPGSGTRVLNEQFLAARGLHPDTRTLGSNGAIKQAARAGLGISLLSRDTVRDEISTGLLGEIALQDGPATRPWFMLRSSVGPTRSSVHGLCEFVRGAAA